jgi:outer membrane protein assembly factor BamB
MASREQFRSSATHKNLCWLTLLSITLLSALAMAQQSASSPSPLPSGSLVDWAQFNFDAAHDGYNPYETILSPANVGDVTMKWSYLPYSAKVEGPPAVANGIVYFGAEDICCQPNSEPNALYAVNADTGAFIWEYPGVYVFQSPTIVNGLVYVTSDGVYALDANTGALVWQSQDSSCENGVTVANGIVYASCSSELAMKALNAQTGAVIWQRPTTSPINSSPSVANGVLYYNWGSGVVDALNASTGAFIWERQLGAALKTPYSLGGNGLGQAVADGVLYVGVQNRNKGQTITRLYALDAGTGATIWTIDGLNLGGTTPAVANGMVYVSSGGSVYALNASTGATIWQYADQYGGPESPVVANGVVYVGSWQVYGFGTGAYTIAAVNASNGNFLWNNTFQSAQYVRIPSPVVVNGTIYGTAVYPGGLGAFGLPN